MPKDRPRRFVQDFQSALVKHGASREAEREASAKLVTKLIRFLTDDGDDAEVRHIRESPSWHCMLVKAFAVRNFLILRAEQETAWWLWHTQVRIHG